MVMSNFRFIETGIDISKILGQIEDKDWQIEQLEDGISDREAEISYWGRKYDSLYTK